MRAQGKLTSDWEGHLEAERMDGNTVLVRGCWRRVLRERHEEEDGQRDRGGWACEKGLDPGCVPCSGNY